MITDMEYLNISALTYDRFNISPEHEGKTIGYIFDNVIPANERNTPELASFDDILAIFTRTSAGCKYEPHGCVVCLCVCFSTELYFRCTVLAPIAESSCN